MKTKAGFEKKIENRIRIRNFPPFMKFFQYPCLDELSFGKY